MATKMAKVEEQELIIKAPGVEIPAEIKEKAEHFIDSYVRHINDLTEAYVTRAAEEVRPEFGEPTLASGYQYWNALTIGPIQFLGNPPYRPNKIIAAGEPTLMLGVVWINPVNSDGGGLPGTVVLGARPYRMRFETVNLSNVSDGPDFTATGVFSSPAPTVSIFPWFFVPGDPGPNPAMFETYMTVDITTMGQPLATFASWHFDVDSEPAFLGLPTVAPHFDHGSPAQFMVYRQ